MNMSETKNLRVTHEPAVLDEPSKLLLKAAALIERVGWCQNSLRSKDGAVCMEGALATALGGSTKYNLLDGGIGEQTWKRLQRNLGTSPWLWNDQKSNTQDEVVAKLRAVALGL